MKMKLMILTVVCCAAILFTGCVKTVTGDVKLGMIGKKDTISGNYPRTVKQVFDASKVVLARMGSLISENTINNSVSASVDLHKVYVKVTAAEGNSTTIEVQVRNRYGGANIDLAAQIEKEVALELVNAR